MSSTNLPKENQKGKILKVKLGYNPNSSSIGSLIFAMPVAMLSAAVAFGTISGVIFSAFTKKKNVEGAKEQGNSDGIIETENSEHTE